MKILYFVNASSPTALELKHAAEIEEAFEKAKIEFIYNTGIDEFFIKCDAVCGNYPKTYAHKDIKLLESAKQIVKTTIAPSAEKLNIETKITVEVPKTTKNKRIEY